MKASLSLLSSIYIFLQKLLTSKRFWLLLRRYWVMHQKKLTRLRWR